MDTIQLTITSKIENIAQVEQFIDDMNVKFVLGEKLQGRIALPIIEAVNNAILYGNKEDAHKVVEIIAVKEDARLTVTVKDEGEGFDYTHIPDPTTPENLMKAAGRGLYLMLKLSDELYFHKNGYGKEVVMIFFLNL